MIRIIATLCIFIFIMTTNVVEANVRITEIAWMGTTESQFAEWFELYNDSDQEVNLAGWKLFEAGGEQLVFTLTKKIQGKDYLLVERTTTSSPDPVPGINDESGPFGGSGFSNTGEHLVLKNSQGVAIQSLNFLAGWPAGDNETKNTMQWDGNKWVTAIPTPKKGLSPGSEEVIPITTKASAGSAWVAPKIEPKIEFVLPKTIYTNVAADFNVRTYLEYGEAYSGLFLWNMGDGTTYKSNKPFFVKHTYKYPGFYTISFVYYKNPYDKKPFLSSFVEKNVTDHTISFSVIKNKGFSFTNSDSISVDLSGWFIVFSDRVIELPPFTIIAPKKTVIMPFESFGVDQIDVNAKLETPDRLVVTKQLVIADTAEVAPKNTITAVPFVQKTDFLEINKDNNVFLDIPEQNKIVNTKNNNTKNIIFGIVILLVIGLFIGVDRSLKGQ